MSARDPLFDFDERELAAHREVLFAATLARVRQAHPFYKRRLAALQEPVESLADLARLPITGKHDYMAEPDAFRLGPEGALGADETIVWDVMYTTGSSGSPTPFVSTSYDFLNILALNRNMMRLRGVTERDSILNLFPLTAQPHGAFTRAMNAAAAFNIPVVAPLPGHVNERRPEIGARLDEVVRIAGRARATILWGVPSYMRRVIARCAELDVRLPDVRFAFVTGEGLGEEGRADLVRRLRAIGATDPVVSISYGATEMQGGMVECRPGAGYHNPAPDQFYFEAVDPDTHAPVADDEEGLILLTHLDRRGTVMLRYSLGDVARMTRARCPHCGALTERLISLPHRVDGLLKIKGMLVNPQTLVDALRGVADIVDFQAVVEKEVAGDALSPDRLVVNVAPADGAPDDLRARVGEKVRAAIGVAPVVRLIAADDRALVERGWKTKPLLDLRSELSH